MCSRDPTSTKNFLSWASAVRCHSFLMKHSGISSAVSVSGGAGLILASPIVIGIGDTLLAAGLGLGFFGVLVHILERYGMNDSHGQAGNFLATIGLLGFGTGILMKASAYLFFGLGAVLVVGGTTLAGISVYNLVNRYLLSSEEDQQ